MQKSGVSIRTLRYYDSIDLLKPSDYTEGGIDFIQKRIWLCFKKLNPCSFSIFP
ncbi:MerR family DNA-binding transcriptional regulator [Lederbergia lenta]|nr:MerR family DNA-binding transcriptional regulator [Lederbergia lenta]MCM3112431.1 MerR family DNA-binding transcriptional regulator [Lederbergia lenta]